MSHCPRIPRFTEGATAGVGEADCSGVTAAITTAILADGKAATSVEAGKGVIDTAGNTFTEPEVGTESVMMLGVVSS